MKRRKTPLDVAKAAVQGNDLESSFENKFTDSYIGEC